MDIEYYSIDKYPDICIAYIKQAVLSEQPKPYKEFSTEQDLGEAIRKAADQIMDRIMKDMLIGGNTTTGIYWK